jgi:hypothetical protein
MASKPTGKGFTSSQMKSRRLKEQRQKRRESEALEKARRNRESQMRQQARRWQPA